MLVFVIKMALIIGHSQVKYFSEYVQDSKIKCLFSSGCMVEDLLTFPNSKEVISAASVSTILPVMSDLYMTRDGRSIPSFYRVLSYVFCYYALVSICIK